MAMGSLTIEAMQNYKKGDKIVISTGDDEIVITVPNSIEKGEIITFYFGGAGPKQLRDPRRVKKL